MSPSSVSQGRCRMTDVPSNVNFVQDATFVKPLYCQGEAIVEDPERVMARLPMGSSGVSGRPESAPTIGRAWSASSAWRAPSPATRSFACADEQQQSPDASAGEEGEEDDSAPNPAVGPMESAHHGAWGSQQAELSDGYSDYEDSEPADPPAAAPAAGTDIEQLWEAHARNLQALRARTNGAPASSPTQRMVTVRKLARHPRATLFSEKAGPAARRAASCAGAEKSPPQTDVTLPSF
jgi:hypothetical protein